MAIPASQTHALPLLHAAFANHLERHWTARYLPFGSHYREASEKDTFWQAVHREFEQAPAVRVKVSKDTIKRNFLGGFTANTHPKTLNAFSQFLGFTNWKAFVTAHPAVPVPPASEQETAPPDHPVGTHPADPIKTYGIALLAVLFIFWVVYRAMACGVAREYPPSATTQSEVTAGERALQTELFGLIRAANAAELAAYKTVPRGDTTGLSRYFLPSGTAYPNIVDRVFRKSEEKAQLRVPPSDYDIVELQLVAYTDSTAELRTKEIWQLQWYIPDQPLGAVYDVLNEQQYFLELGADQRWRVKGNHYQGRARPGAFPIPPPRPRPTAAER